MFTVINEMCFGLIKPDLVCSTEFSLESKKKKT